MLYIYNDYNLLEVEGGLLSFINITPIKSWKDMDYVDESVKEKYKKEKMNLIKSMSPFDKGSMLTSPKYGASYKIISYYKKLDPVQTYNIDEGNNIFNKLNKRVDFKLKSGSFEQFMNMKKREKTATIINEEFYTKNDFIITKTTFPELIYKEFIKLPKKMNIENYLKKLDDELFEVLKNPLELLFMEHEKNYLRIVKTSMESEYHISVSNILEVFTKLNLGQNLSNIYDNNFMNNNFNNSYRNQNEKEIIIYKNKEKNIIERIILKNNYIEYINIKEKTKKVKIYMDENVKIYEKDGFLRIRKETLSNGENIEEDIFPPIKIYTFEIKDKRDELKYYLLEEIPEQMEETLSEDIEEILKEQKLEEFSIILDVLKYSSKQLEKEVNSKEGNMKNIQNFQKVNFGEWIYEKKLTLEREKAFNSMNEYIKDGLTFTTIRYGFILKKHSFNNNFSFALKTKFQDLDIVFNEIKYNMTKLLYPIPYTKFLLMNNKMKELELTDIINLINFKYGNSYFSGRNDNNQLDLPKINDACMFLKINGKIQGMNIFDGPDMFNGLIIAPSGSGKSFITVNMIDGFMEEPNNLTWILDRGGSYNSYCTAKDGINISINQSNSSNCINPFLFDLYFGIQIYLENTIIKESITKEENEIFNKMKYLFYLKEGDEFKKKKLDKTSEQKRKKIYQKSPKYKSILLNFEKIEDCAFNATIPQNKMDIYKTIIMNMMEIQETHSQYHIIEANVAQSLKEYIMEETKKKVEQIFKDKKNLIKEINLLRNYKLSFEKIDILIDKLDKLMFNSLFLKINIIKDKVEDNLERELSGIPPKQFTAAINKFIDINSYGKIFNGKPSLDMTRQLINIDFGEIQDEKISNLVLSALLMNFFSVMTNPLFKNSKKLLVIDEAHAILNANSLVGLKSISYLFRTTRKWGASVFLLSQGISDFKKEAGETEPIRKTLFDGIFENAGWVILLGNHNAAKAKKAFGFSDEVSNDIQNNDKSLRLFYLKSQLTSNFCQLLVTSLDYWTATTNKEEKNILVLIKKITGSSLFSLQLASKIFGMGFLSDFKDNVNLIKQKSSNYVKTKDNIKNIVYKFEKQNYKINEMLISGLSDFEFKLIAALLILMEEQEYQGFRGAPVLKD